MGHSVGEYAAACIAGMLSLEDAIRLVIARGRLMGALPAGGAMAAVFAPEDECVPPLRKPAAAVSIAAVNGPTNIVMSGAAEDSQAVAVRLEAEGVELQRLNVSHAFHSPLMDPMLDEFEEVAAGVRFEVPKITLFRTVRVRAWAVEGAARSIGVAICAKRCASPFDRSTSGRRLSRVPRNRTRADPCRHGAAQRRRRGRGLPAVAAPRLRRPPLHAGGGRASLQRRRTPRLAGVARTAPRSRSAADLSVPARASLD